MWPGRRFMRRKPAGGDAGSNDGSPRQAQSVRDSTIHGDLRQTIIERQYNIHPTTAPSQVVVGEIPAMPAAVAERALLERLTRALDRNIVAVVCALTGMRGVGKTQLAAAYARSKIADGCRLVGWVNAETTGDLIAGLARIADRLEIADPSGDSAE